MDEEKKPGKYRTTNGAAYNAALKARGSLMVWLEQGTQWLVLLTGKPGRQPKFSDAAIQFIGEGEWKRKKHRADYRRQWRKVRLGIGEQTLEIRAIEVTDNAVGDAPMLPELLKQIEPDEAIASVSADGAYDTKTCHAAIAARGAMAVIPPRKNAQVWKGDGAGAQVRNAAVAACKRLGRQICKRWSGYHRRSLVETKMHCFKRRGERVMARSFVRQVVALLNRFTQLGTPVTVAVA